MNLSEEGKVQKIYFLKRKMTQNDDFEDKTPLLGGNHLFSQKIYFFAKGLNLLLAKSDCWKTFLNKSLEMMFKNTDKYNFW